MEKNIKLLELRKLQTDFKSVKIDGSLSAANYVRQFWGDDIEIFESAFILLLNAQHKTIAYAKISQGGIVGTVVDIRLIAKYAIEALAIGVILAHNHPSGVLIASSQDVGLSKKIEAGLALLDIILLDSLIITTDGYTSLSDDGVI